METIIITKNEKIIFEENTNSEMNQNNIESLETKIIQQITPEVINIKEHIQTKIYDQIKQFKKIAINTLSRIDSLFSYQNKINIKQSSNIIHTNNEVLSKEQIYEKEFKNLFKILGYSAQSFLDPNKFSELSSYHLDLHLNDFIKEKLQLNEGEKYIPNLIIDLNIEDQLMFIHNIILPTIIETINETTKLFKVLKDLKEINPLYQEISQAVKQSNIEESLFMALLFQSPKLLINKNIPKIEELLLKTNEIENFHYKNEQLFSTNLLVTNKFIEIVNHVQKFIMNLDCPLKIREKNCMIIQKNFLSLNDSNHKIFQIVKDKIVCSLQHEFYLKSELNVIKKIFERRIANKNISQTHKDVLKIY